MDQLQVLVIEHKVLQVRMEERFKEKCSITAHSVLSLDKANSYAKLIIVNLNAVTNVKAYEDAIRRKDFFHRPDVLCVYLTRYRSSEEEWEKLNRQLGQVHLSEHVSAYRLHSTATHAWELGLWGIAERFMESQQR